MALRGREPWGTTRIRLTGGEPLVRARPGGPGAHAGTRLAG